MTLPLSPTSNGNNTNASGIANSTTVSNNNNNHGNNNNNNDKQSPPSSSGGAAPAAATTHGTNAANNNNATGTANGMKRKPSRRANTAERRATHNAVERQRRETLNGRFLVRPLSSFLVFILTLSTGPSSAPPELDTNPAPLEILHRQQQHRPYPRLATAPFTRRAGAEDPETRSGYAEAGNQRMARSGGCAAGGRTRERGGIWDGH